ncbi:NLR family CARD domain-containing protein 3-like [Dermacentor albipictus]|uniref:NLR family CARD domain-containing protein 3-like n=1 Tax=Dermacentor albipictus TaxID=60249 RepID=UPI0031FE1BAA
MEPLKAPGESCGLSRSVPLPKYNAASDKTSAGETGGSSDSKEYKLGLERAVSTDTWKDQLDFERACYSAGPGERCWLIGELTSWNRVLQGLAFELVEAQPGSIRAQTLAHSETDLDKPDKVVASEASFLISWLLGHHQCIDELSVLSYKHSSYDAGSAVSFPICMRPPLGCEPDRYFRCLKIELADFSFSMHQQEQTPYLHTFEGLDAVSGLEKLKVGSPKIEFRFAAELESLLRRNASTLKAVQITKAILPKNVDYALRCLVNCESLTLYPYFDWGDRVPSMDSVAQLIRKTSALKKLSIYPIAKKQQMTTIAEAIKVNTSLAELYVHVVQMSCSPEPLFAALQVNRTLKELRLMHCCIKESSGRALASALWENTSLRSLHIGNSTISEISMKLLAAVLLVNTTLEQIQLSSEQLPIGGVFALCSSLGKNKTLKKLSFVDFRASKQEREALALQLATSESYSRVQLPWAEPDLHGLRNALISPTVCPEEVCFRDIRHLPEEGLKLLLDAVAASARVHTFRVCLKGNLGTKGAALCEMLKTNRSIRTLEISIEKDSGNLVHNVLLALAANTSISKVMIGIDIINKFETATDLSYFLAHNKTVTSLVLSSMTFFYNEFVGEFSKGMWQNRLIVNFKLACNFLCNDESFTVFEALRRNKGTLNRAVDFVLLHKADRECAEAFELFSKTPCLLAHVVNVTGKMEGEALVDIASAAHFLTDNYLIITGVVYKSVECHSAKGTQVAALNKDCWRAILRHLCIADVLAP